MREIIGNNKTTNIATYISKPGALVVDSVTSKIYIHDGVTPGGTLFTSTSGDGSSLTVIPTGATTARTLASREADTFNVLDNGIKNDGTTDNATALTALLSRAATMAAAQGGKVDVVFPSGNYGFGSVVTVPTGVRLIGSGKPTLTAIGTGGGILAITTGNVELRNLILNSQKSIHTAANVISITNATGGVILEDIELINPTGPIAITTSYDVQVIRPIVTASLSHGVILTTSYDCTVIGGKFQSLVYFGIILTAGSYRNKIEGNHTTANGIELIGITQDSYENRIIGNHAEGTGDNGISVTGFKNVVMGNICKGCQGNGITVYGERNLVVGNTCLNNAQGNGGNAGWRAGIAIQPGFGGTGQYNVVTSNILDDEQGVITQLYGVWIGADNYVLWTSGSSQTISSYVYYGLNLYIATTTGTTGSTAPTWTNTQSDGAVSWKFVRTFSAGTLAANYNEISSNMVRNFGTSRYLDASGGSNNEFIGGLVPVVLPSPIVASQISNPGGVSAVGLPVGSYSFSNGSIPTIAISAPTGSGGQQATASVTSMFMFGFGSIAAGSAGYSVNDVLSFVGGTTLSGLACAIKVLTVDGSGKILTFTNNGTGSFYYTALPPSGNTALSGGTGTGAALTGVVWHINAITVTASGSGYLSVPTVTYSPSITAISTPTLASAMTINAGIGQIYLDGTGTKLGLIGASGAPVLNMGASIDASGVRQTLTGSAYTVPANTSLVRFVQTGTIASQTVTLPTALADGQVIQFVNYAGVLTSLTFSPAVSGWTNTSTLAANTGLRVRWDSAAVAWQREQ